MSIVPTDMKIVHGNVPCNKVDAVIIVWIFKVKMSLIFQNPFNLIFLRGENLAQLFMQLLTQKSFRFSLDMVN